MSNFSSILSLTAPFIKPITKQSTAIRVTLSYQLDKKFTEESQLSTFGFVFDKATKQQKNKVENESRTL